MWYVFYCPNLESEKMMRFCRQHFSQKALKEVFLFTYDRMRRYEGAWHMERQELFPNYIFLESEDENCLKKEWECCGDIAQILGENKEIIPIQMEEEMFLKSMCDDSHHIEMSRGYIRDGFTTVTEGALCGKEKWIRKIDRHKRLAKLELPCGGRWKETQVGLEIVKKE